MNNRRWAIVWLATLFLGGGWLWMSRVPADALTLLREAEPAVDHPAPDFTLTTLTGDSFTLSELQGTPVVLNFWATWCGPCQRELPALQSAAERYAGKIIIVGVDQGEAADVVQPYADELGLTFPVPLDVDFAVGDRYDIRGLPTTFFIDRDGMIRSVWAGEMNSITLAEHIAKIVP